MAAALSAGFAAPVFDAQRVFRAAMQALATPARPIPLAVDLDPPAPLTPMLAALALTLADAEAPLWLDAPLAASAEVAAFLTFHTGAAIVADPAAAAFALIADPAAVPAFASFAIGTDAYPDRSTTLILAVASLENPADAPRLSGPGIEREARLAASPLPADIWDRLAANRALFPRGVDLILAAPEALAGLPRSIRVTQGG